MRGKIVPVSLQPQACQCSSWRGADESLACFPFQARIIRLLSALSAIYGTSSGLTRTITWGPTMALLWAANFFSGALRICASRPTEGHHSTNFVFFLTVFTEIYSFTDAGSGYTMIRVAGMKIGLQVRSQVTVVEFDCKPVCKDSAVC